MLDCKLDTAARAKGGTGDTYSCEHGGLMVMDGNLGNVDHFAAGWEDIRLSGKGGISMKNREPKDTRVIELLITILDYFTLSRASIV